MRWSPVVASCLLFAAAHAAEPADVAVARTADGLFSVSTDGAPPKALPAPKGTLGWCSTDPRANGVWVLEDAPGDAPDTLHFVDLQTGETRPVVRGIPGDLEEVIIDHGEAGRIGGHDRVELRVGMAIRMGPKPAVEPEIGCEGDASWYCYDNETLDKPEPTLLPEYAARRDAVVKLKLVDAAWLATIVKRGAARPLTKAVKARPELPKVKVPVERCQAAPEDCGLARALPGTPYWRVIVSNDRGDFYYQDEQLYDPGSKTFFDLSTPPKRSAEPLTEGQSVEGLRISPSGAAYLAWSSIGRFDGKPVKVPAKARICGWVGPAVRIGGPRG